MRILIGWDDPAEAELIALYLQAGGNDVRVVASPEELVPVATADDGFDAILMTTASPDADAAYATFVRLREVRPETPIVGACRTGDVFRLAQFLTQGLRSYVLRDLGGDFVFLLQSTLESTVEAVRAERERRIGERMRDEIESVRRFQASIIPQRMPDVPGYRLAGRYEPSQIRVVGGRPVPLAGGDCYDVIPLDAKSCVLLMADASGHGMRACMSIMTLHTLVRMLSGQKHRTTAAFLREVNRAFCDQSANRTDGSLVTLFYGVLRTDRHELQWSSAGHPIPLVDRPDVARTEAIAANDVAGPPLGVDPDVKYETLTTKLPPGSRLLIYTDGLVEAYPETDARGLFGVEGVTATLARDRSASPAERAAQLFADSEAHTAGSGRVDDTSAILLHRT